MPKNLLIVESPAKAKTINNYLGKDFLVLSSYGHVRDLPKGNHAIDVENGFIPHYEINSDKKDVIKKLEVACESAQTIYLATDDDREGEAISWHLKEALGLSDERIQRIVFHEITKKAIEKALQSPRKINQDLVNAQQARRILDRLVGFELSPILWKKIKSNLSAGRVQSAAVRIIVEREREIDKFSPDNFFKVQALFDLKGGSKLKAELNDKLKEEKDAEFFLQACSSSTFSIRSLDKKPSKKSPSAPFTTSTLQQEASRKLGMGVTQTMALAQKLYEAGLITYMRTDSVSMSQDALTAAKAAISSNFGSKYSFTRQFKTKSASAQEAHEAIRPTDFNVSSAGGDDRERRLYELIYKRAIASQMADAALERTVAAISISKLKDKELTATGEVVIFDGFLRVYQESSDDDTSEESGMLPPLNIGQVLDLERMTASERFTRPKARYTEASLVKALEENGIGRPSTYAPTISTVQKRGYVVKEDRPGSVRTFVEWILSAGKIEKKIQKENVGVEKNKLFPTNMGMVVNDFLVKYFSEIVDLSFTANVEKQFDEIADGQMEWGKMISEFYYPFHSKVESTDTNVDRSEVNVSRSLGIDPKTGREVIARMGRYGPLVELKAPNEDEKPQFASLVRGQFLESIQLSEALELFKLPREVGMFEDKVIKANIGKFGPYVLHNSAFVSLRKDQDPYSIDLESAIALILEKREKDLKKLIKEFEENVDIKVLNGRWGPYISYQKESYKIPKEKDPASLSLEECLAIIDASPKKPAKVAKATTKSASTKTSTTKEKATSKKATVKSATAKKTTSKSAASKTKTAATAKKKPTDK